MVLLTFLFVAGAVFLIVPALLISVAGVNVWVRGCALLCGIVLMTLVATRMIPNDTADGADGGGAAAAFLLGGAGAWSLQLVLVARSRLGGDNAGS